MLAYIFLILSLICLAIYKSKFSKNKYFKAILMYLFISLLASSLMEIFIFNYRHFESLTFSNNTTLKNYTLGDGIKCKKDICNVSDLNNAYIEIENIDKEIKNLYLDFDSNQDLTIIYEIYFTDEANALYFDGGKSDYTTYAKNSKYVRIHTSGVSEKLKIKINEISGGEFKINKIEINKTVPLMVNNLRLLITTLFILTLCFINPKSILHDLKFNTRVSKVIIVIFTIVVSLVFWKLTTYNNFINSMDSLNSNQAQYKNLARALANKKFNLDLEVSDKLLELDNPYDISYRDSKLSSSDYFWDYAFYNGKYYSYFGIVPCLLTYLPYYIITNNDLSNHLATAILSVLLLISSLYLMYQFMNKYFKNTSLINYLLISTLFIASSCIITLLGSTSFYNIPIFTGVAFACLGLGCWIKATNYNCLKKRYLFLGSLFMSLVAGCRPQILLSGFLAIFVFWDYVFKKRELFSKKSIKETLSLIFPIIVIACLLMYYNYARFNNPFDFGANYNLTSNDMTKRGFEFDRIFLGIYNFVFAPNKITNVFPFFGTYEITTKYIGRTIWESMYGGYLFINLVCILGLLSFKFKNVIKNKELYRMSIACIVFAFIIVIADTQMAGILRRYTADFGWLIMLSTIIVILSLFDKYNSNINMKKVIMVFILLSIISNLLLYNISEYLLSYNTMLYYKLYYMFSFWL